MPLNNLEAKTQLRETIEIIYVVDGYLATFCTANGDSDVCEAHGETILDALTALDRLLPKDWTREKHYQGTKQREHIRCPACKGRGEVINS